MNSINYIKNALKDLDEQVQKILLEQSLALNEKDNLMLPILQQKKILEQTLKDLTYLKENPTAPNQPCGISKYRNDSEIS